MAGIQRFIEGYLLKKHIRETERSAHLLNIEQVDNICLLVDLEGVDGPEELRTAHEALLQGGKKVDLVCYFDNHELPLEFTGGAYHYLDKRDMNVLQIPKTGSIKNLLDNSYDLMLLYNPGGHFALYYLSAILDSKLRIGDNDHGKRSVIEFRLVVQKQQLQHFIQVAINYLKHINKSL